MGEVMKQILLLVFFSLFAGYASGNAQLVVGEYYIEYGLYVFIDEDHKEQEVELSAIEKCNSTQVERLSEFQTDYFTDENFTFYQLTTAHYRCH